MGTRVIYFRIRKLPSDTNLQHPCHNKQERILCCLLKKEKKKKNSNLICAVKQRKFLYRRETADNLEKILRINKIK